MPRNQVPTSGLELLLLARLSDELARGLRRLAVDYVDEARRRGATWSDVGNAYNVTPQTAHHALGSAPRTSIDASASTFPISARRVHPFQKHVVVT